MILLHNFYGDNMIQTIVYKKNDYEIYEIVFEMDKNGIICVNNIIKKEIPICNSDDFEKYFIF